MEKYKPFLDEKRYMGNLSPKTLELYRYAFVSLETHAQGELTAAGLMKMVVGLRETGRTTATINTRLRCLKTYIRWAGLDVKVPILKEQQRVLRIFTPEDLKKLISARVKLLGEKRIQTLTLLLLDTGLRLEEALALRTTDIDFDNLLVTVKGKGNKERKVPFSFECRKILWAHCRGQVGYVFGTRRGRLTKRNAYRDFMRLCRNLGITPPPRAIHSLRSTFSVNYLRNGGNIYYLQRLLGHTSIRTTTLYLRAVQVDDLSAVHQGLSPLSRIR